MLKRTDGSLDHRPPIQLLSARDAQSAPREVSTRRVLFTRAAGEAFEELAVWNDTFFSLGGLVGR
jgi:hypothetical protein